MPRKAGTPNRNYPPNRLGDALKVPRAIQDEASGMEVSRLTLAELLGTTPSSSVFTQLVASSRFYGLTKGGINSEQFSLTDIGEKATAEDETERSAALKQAVMKIAAFATFFRAFTNKKFPGPTAFKEFLAQSAGVPSEHAEACMAHIVADAETAGLVRTIRGAKYVDLDGTPVEPAYDDLEEGSLEHSADDPLTAEVREMNGGNGKVKQEPPEPETPRRPNKIFVGGRKTKSLEQLTKILDEYKIPYMLVEDEPNRGRPISTKVRDALRECGAAILVFTPDEELRDLDGNPVWRPTENVVHELGAASMEYGNRIVIFREERVDFAANYADIGHIVFKENDLSAKAIELFRELVDFGLVTFTVGV